MVNKFIGEVAAPEFGDGFTIRLDIAGQAELETAFGDKDHIGLFAVRVQYGLAALETTHLLAFLKAALRKDGVRVTELPEIPAPLAPICTKCLDAFALFRYGKPHEQWVAENAKETEKPKANPTKGTKA